MAALVHGYHEYKVSGKQPFEKSCIICVGRKLTKFRGRKEIIENHESFYPRKFLAVWYAKGMSQPHVL